ncbi:retropepsin-like aspartic protease [Pelomonas sp. SE-A7]|uniref:retropepsin-like aspartic protease family protein n=1 Tax=Pelomonas sp. SE-A7 TaxID=3054953 RepID=UPI00259D2A7C|nr:retropepsin-like aspartic protease [Pelomonas sp. SE-A7]MDM4768238.1 retropepsin-like aspartic protease [Pelomonas sp. SE-A7]
MTNRAQGGNRELPHTFKLVTIWLLVTVVVFLGFKAWERDQRSSRFRVETGGEIVLRRGADGHFHWPGKLGNVEVEFMVDTGATSTALPEALARRAGLQALGEVRSNTAGGLSTGWLARADLQLQGGVEAQRLPVTVLPNLDAPLLGMDMLSRMQMQMNGNELRLKGPR